MDNLKLGLWNLLTSEEKDNIVEETKKLRSDCVFLKEMVIRMKTVSSFTFDLAPREVNGSSKLLKRLWFDYYHCNIEDVRTMIVDHYVAKELIKALHAEWYYRFNPECAKEIITYFDTHWDINLADYVGDFINCSHGCEKIAAKIEEIRAN